MQAEDLGLRTLEGHSKLLKGILIFALLLAPAFSDAMPVLGKQCTIKIDKVTFPEHVSPGQTFDLTTQLTATYSTARGNAATARVDLVDGRTGHVLSIKSVLLPYQWAPAPNTVTVTHSVSAPSITGNWQLDLRVYCITTLGGTGISDMATQSLAVPVGTQPTTITTTAVATTTTLALTTTGTAGVITKTLTQTTVHTITESPPTILVTDAFSAAIIGLVIVALAMAVVFLMFTKKKPQPQAS